jgi:hypothetical protein
MFNQTYISSRLTRFNALSKHDPSRKSCQKTTKWTLSPETLDAAGEEEEVTEAEVAAVDAVVVAGAAAGPRLVTIVAK